MNYAEFVFVTLATLAFAPGEVPTDNLLQLRLGRNAVAKRGPGKEGIGSLEWGPGRELFRGTALQPFGAFGAAPDGMRYLTIGIRKDIKLGPATLRPSFGPSLYSSGRGLGKNERLQFRTSVDLSMNTRTGLGIGLGFYHLSNARLSAHTASIDVFYVSVQSRF